VPQRKTLAILDNKFDPNLWLFLFGVWRVAVDLTHHTWWIISQDCNHDGGKVVAQDMLALASAFTVLWIGMQHCILLLVVSLCQLNIRLGIPPWFCI
jgi:hypothetical protein